MRFVLFWILVFTATIANSQNVIDWDPNYKLQLSDFRSKNSQVGSGNLYSVHSSCRMDFGFHMTNYEFMFAKNFNSKVSCTFTRDLALLIAPDSATAAALVNFTQFEFDLGELYARKFRRRLFEEKGAFSNVQFFQPIYDQIQKEYLARYSAAGAETDIGRNEEKLKTLQAEVTKEIQSLSDFCKTCKPSKKKKLVANEGVGEKL